jgi:xylulose-5-phosphate/fructose-6-phosphate phosphoketolase
MAMMNDLDCFHPVTDVVDRLPDVGGRSAYVKQTLRDKLIEHKEDIVKHGEDMPEIREWRWAQCQP